MTHYVKTKTRIRWRWVVAIWSVEAVPTYFPPQFKVLFAPRLFTRPLRASPSKILRLPIRNAKKPFWPREVMFRESERQREFWWNHGWKSFYHFSTVRHALHCLKKFWMRVVCCWISTTTLKCHTVGFIFNTKVAIEVPKVSSSNFVLGMDHTADVSKQYPVMIAENKPVCRWRSCVKNTFR